MTFLKIIESQNGQIYPEDTFSHGAAHLIFRTKFLLHFSDPIEQICTHDKMSLYSFLVCLPPLDTSLPNGFSLFGGDVGVLLRTLV